MPVPTALRMTETGNADDNSVAADSITAASLSRHVRRLAADIGERNVFHPQALQAAEDYIRQCWQQQGYQVTPQDYVAMGVRSANLEVTRRGSRHPDEILLLGAHYDSVRGSPGANDNGSGVAALLELSRLFSTIEPPCTVRFVAFTNEEPPFFPRGRPGSMLYAREARRRGDAIRLMIALETIGSYSSTPGSQRYPPLFRYFFPDRGDYIAFVSNFRSRKPMRRLAQAFRASTDFPLQHVATSALVPGVAWSDHLSFWRKHYRAMMITDTAFYRCPYYHTTQDTPEKLNYDEFARMLNGLYRALRRMSETLL
jgi:Zn-dependent M28 family amino/carboxypeptidase